MWDTDGWLAKEGYVDFAGSSVVHMGMWKGAEGLSREKMWPRSRFILSFTFDGCFALRHEVSVLQVIIAIRLVLVAFIFGTWGQRKYNVFVAFFLLFQNVPVHPNM